MVGNLQTPLTVEQFSSLWQEMGPVRNCVAWVKGLPEEQCLGYFFSSCRRVCIHGSSTVMQAVELTMDVEDELSGEHKESDQTQYATIL